VVKMEFTLLKQFVTQNENARLYYNSILNQRKELSSNLKGVINLWHVTQQEIHYTLQKDLPESYVKFNNDYLVIQGFSGVNSMIVKSSGTQSKLEFREITSYTTNHLRSSIIKNILLSTNYMGVAHISKDILFMLYHYYFYRRNENDRDAINDIASSVVCELENLIKVLIEKQDTIYRGKDISVIVPYLVNMVRMENIAMFGNNFNVRI